MHSFRSNLDFTASLHFYKNKENKNYFRMKKSIVGATNLNLPPVLSFLVLRKNMKRSKLVLPPWMPMPWTNQVPKPKSGSDMSYCKLVVLLTTLRISGSPAMHNKNMSRSVDLLRLSQIREFYTLHCTIVTKGVKTSQHMRSHELMR